MIENKNEFAYLHVGGEGSVDRDFNYDLLQITLMIPGSQTRGIGRLREEIDIEKTIGCDECGARNYLSEEIGPRLLKRMKHQPEWRSFKPRLIGRRPVGITLNCLVAEGFPSLERETGLDLPPCLKGRQMREVRLRRK